MPQTHPQFAVTIYFGKGIQTAYPYVVHASNEAEARKVALGYENITLDELRGAGGRIEVTKLANYPE